MLYLEAEHIEKYNDEKPNRGVGKSCCQIVWIRQFSKEEPWAGGARPWPNLTLEENY
ncbi:MAG: hypothetical protein R6U91_10055 [Bacillota bacterium]